MNTRELYGSIEQVRIQLLAIGANQFAKSLTESETGGYEYDRVCDLIATVEVARDRVRSVLLSETGPIVTSCPSAVEERVRELALIAAELPSPPVDQPKPWRLREEYDLATARRTLSNAFNDFIRLAVTAAKT